MIEEYKKRLKKAIAAERVNRENAVLSLRMSDGDQWSEKELRRRDAKGRPALTGNLLEASIMQAVGDERHNHARVKVRPASANGDSRLAEIRAGIISEVEYVSNAEAIYDYAHEMQCRGAYGAWRVLTRYCVDNPFIQEIYLERIKNPLTVLIDPDARDAQGADAKYAFILERMSEEDFKERYPGKDISSDPVQSTPGMSKEGSYDEGSVTVCEYYLVEDEKETFCLLSDGRVMKKGEAEAAIEAVGQQVQQQEAMAMATMPGAMPSPDMPSLSIVDEREAETPHVYRYVMSDSEILDDKAAIPGQFIPVVVAKGKEYNVEGETRVKSLVANALDPQRYYNYWISATAEVVSKAPTNPFVATARQIKGYESLYAQANTGDVGVLLYNVDPDSPMAKPTREPPAPVPQAMLVEVEKAEGLVRKAIGMGNRDIGEVGPERSGLAIRQIQKPGDIGTFAFVDNLNRAIQHSGRIINSMIPEVYDTERDVRVRNEDSTEHFVPVNITARDFMQHTNKNPGLFGRIRRPEQVRLSRFMSENGEDGIYNSMKDGQFEVMIDTGPNYATQRQETSDSLLKFSQFDKRLLMLAGDIVYKNQDFMGASEIARRYRKTLPKGMVDLEEGEEPLETPTPPSVQAELLRLQTAGAELDIKKQELKIKEQELDLRKIQALKEAQGTAGDIRKAVIGILAELLGPSVPVPQDLSAPPDENQGGATLPPTLEASQGEAQ